MACNSSLDASRIPVNDDFFSRFGPSEVYEVIQNIRTVLVFNINLCCFTIS